MARRLSGLLLAALVIAGSGCQTLKSGPSKNCVACTSGNCARHGVGMASESKLPKLTIPTPSTFQNSPVD